MPLAKTDILASYNQVYQPDNGIAKTYPDLSPRDIVEALLIYMIDNTGGAGGGLTVPQVTSAIEAATNLDDIEPLLTQIEANTSGLTVTQDYKPLFDFAPEVLTAPGNGTTLDVSDYRSFVVQYDITNIDTSVTVRIEGSNDSSTFFNLSENGDTTKTANNTHSFISPPFISLRYLRFVFVSETGGTNANITIKVTVG